MPICHICKKKVPKLEYHLLAEQFANTILEMLSSGYSVLYLNKNSKTLFGIELSYTRIQVVLNHRNLSSPTLRDTANSKVVRDLYKQTVEEKYGSGITNVSQALEIKCKKDKTNLERYGVTNPFQRPEIIKKSKETLFTNYGVYHSCDIPNRPGRSGRYSAPHRKISQYLTDIGVSHVNDYPGMFRKFNTNLGRYYSPIPDIFIPEINLVIEVFGDRWHMNPNMYYETDVVKFFAGFYTAKEVWEGEQIRNEHIKSFGVDLLIIWEYDIKHNLIETKTRLMEKISELSKN